MKPCTCEPPKSANAAFLRLWYTSLQIIADHGTMRFDSRHLEKYCSLHSRLVDLSARMLKGDDTSQDINLCAKEIIEAECELSSEVESMRALLIRNRVSQFSTSLTHTCEAA